MNLGAPELLMLLIVPLWVAGLVWWIYSIVEVAKIPAPAYGAAGKEKVTWVLIVVLLGILGTLIWWFAARPAVKAETRRASGEGQPHGGPPQNW